MNFFEHQQRARNQSRRLVVLFVLAVVAIVLAVDVAVLLALDAASSSSTLRPGGFHTVASHSGALLLATLATLAIITVASFGRIASLRSGGAAVAQQLGATRVPEDIRDPALRRLRNVVEEIAIAASVPVPEIFVLEREEAINAFAAGYTPSDAAITVTRGALVRLNRDELQGVIAHEFSHVLNGDMRLNIRLMGWLFGILVLGLIGRKVLTHARGGRNSKNAGAVLLIAFAVMVIGYAGVFFGRLIKAAVSRQREYLADASAVQFTRQSAGIAGALKKIAGLPAGSRLINADSEEVSHMLFGDGMGYSSLYATHPPLLKRIQILDPSFDAAAADQLVRQYHAVPPDGLAEDRMMGLDRPAAPSSAVPAANTEVELSPATAVGRVGAPEAASYRHAAALRMAIPEALRAAAHTRAQAPALVLALLLAEDEKLHAIQLAAVSKTMGAAMATQTTGFFAATRELHPALRLPLATLAFPALRHGSPEESRIFLTAINAVIHADNKTDLFEFCLGRLLDRQLSAALNPAAERSAGNGKLPRCEAEVAVLLAVLAQHGHTGSLAARRAYLAGMARVLPQSPAAYQPPEDWVAALDRVLPVLDKLLPEGKTLLLEGMVETCGHDGRVSAAEAELLRTLCACLHCPLPPLLGVAALEAAA